MFLNACVRRLDFGLMSHHGPTLASNSQPLCLHCLVQGSNPGLQSSKTSGLPTELCPKIFEFPRNSTFETSVRIGCQSFYLARSPHGVSPGNNLSMYWLNFLSTHFSLIPYFKKTGIIPTSDNFYTASPRQVADPSDTCERWSSYR